MLGNELREAAEMMNVVSRIMTPPPPPAHKEVHVLIPGNHHFVLLLAKGKLSLQMELCCSSADLEMDRSTWIIQVGLMQM